jgi:hypothetical protein
MTSKKPTTNNTSQTPSPKPSPSKCRAAKAPPENGFLAYRIYLTKSCSAAAMIAAGLNVEYRGRGAAISHGAVLKDGRIPAIYHGKGWWYALVRYKKDEIFDSKIVYEIIIC